MEQMREEVAGWGWQATRNIINRSKPPSVKREQELSERIMNSKGLDVAAVTELVSCNLRLVYWIAHKYRFSGIPIEDLFQEGVIGLITAAHRFDYTKGRFTTLAVWWVRQSVGIYIKDNMTTIRIPVYVHDLRTKFIKSAQRLEGELGRRPSVEEIAADCEVEVRKISDVLLDIQREVGEVSLDEPVRREVGTEPDKRSVADSAPDYTTSDPEQNVMAKDNLRVMKSILQKTLLCLNKLSPRNREIFSRRYGIDPYKNKLTLEEVAAHFSITGERVRQILVRAWATIRLQMENMDEEAFCHLIDGIEILEEMAN